MKNFSSAATWSLQEERGSMSTGWICFSNTINTGLLPFNQIVASHLETMETDSRFAAWQVKQAADAILLYAEKYLKSDKRFITLSTSDSIELKSNISNSGKNLHDWKEIFIRLHENMRLRHYSPRTEKSYRIWINKFSNHLNSRDPLTLEGKDVKGYLTHIAPREAWLSIL